MRREALIWCCRRRALRSLFTPSLVPALQYTGYWRTEDTGGNTTTQRQSHSILRTTEDKVVVMGSVSVV